MHLKFVETESTFDYFQATREYLEAHGKPVAFYSDKHGVFRVNSTGAVQGDGMTQFGRSLHALNIDILCANTPQAKGRVERANKTLQDRLVKELRLQGISTIAAGNELLPDFLADYNARFGKEPRNPKNLHRPLSVGDDLTDVFAWREERTVSNSLTLQYDKVVFLLEPNAITRELCRKRVTVVDIPTAGWRSATVASICPTLPLTNCGRFRRPPSSRTSTSAPSSRRSASASSNVPKLAASPRHAARGRSATCSKSAEPDPAAAMASRHRTSSTALSPSPILCNRRDAVKPGPTGPRLRRLRA